jgi:two-component system copper resistance phosphate regulon response regulator CusR
VRILVAEDEPAAGWILEKGLREHGYEVDLVRSGVSALARASSYSYDLLLLDLGLPGKDGVDVCRELRGRQLSMPVLMLTARDAVQDRVTGLDAGGDDYLVKPYDFQELLARIRALLRRPPAVAAEVLVVEDLSLAMRSREVRRGGLTVELTAKEYALLEYLARRAGEVVSRDDILENVWAGYDEPDSNVVEVYVRRLRLKIDEGRAVPLIHTRRGHGYVLGVRPVSGMA